MLQAQRLAGQHVLSWLEMLGKAQGEVHSGNDLRRLSRRIEPAIQQEARNDRTVENKRELAKFK